MPGGRGNIKPSDNPKPFSSENQPENNGRKKKLPELDALLAELLGSSDGDIEGSEAKEVFNALVKQAKKGNVPAAIAVLNRAYGMPKQPHEHGGKDGNPIQFEEIPLEKRIAALALLEPEKDGE